MAEISVIKGETLFVKPYKNAQVKFSPPLENLSFIWHTYFRFSTGGIRIAQAIRFIPLEVHAKSVAIASGDLLLTGFITYKKALKRKALFVLYPLGSLTGYLQLLSNKTCHYRHIFGRKNFGRLCPHLLAKSKIADLKPLTTKAILL